MAIRILTYLFLLCLVLACASRTATTALPANSNTATAGLNWKKTLKAAQAAQAAGEIAQAADLYKTTWDKNPKQTKALHQAAELYSGLQDYRKAVEAYQFLLPAVEEYPLSGLKLGRLLKQDGQYDRAQRTLARFLETYNETDRPIIEEIVAIELAGVELALRQAGQASELKLSRPDKGINSEADEYGPIPIDIGQLYFSSNRGGQSRLYESRQQGRDWGNATAPQGFPVITEGQYGSGSISPDGERFYFTICSGMPEKNSNARCELFRSNRTPNGWGQAIALPDYINASGTNNLEPHSAIVNGRELLFFVSNREGGRGGLDIWYVARNMGFAEGDFSYPVNLGPVINSTGDERSPYYSNSELTLYFSSNGHPSLGGLDVFRAAGQEVNWARPENLGIPINSPADDYGFVIDQKGGGNGYLVSNRPFGGLKNNTTERDIFQVNLQAGQILLKATAYDNQAGLQLSDITVALFQIYQDGNEEKLVERNFPSGSYLFELIPNQRFRVEVRKAGYESANYTFTTNIEGVTVYGQPLFLLPAAAITPSQPTTSTYPDPNTQTPTYPGAGTYPNQPALQPATNPANTAPSSTAPVAPSGRYYKIQISAVRSFDPNEGQYQAIRAFGDIAAELIPANDLSRIMVGTYVTEQAAKEALSSIQRNGFPSAFTVRYDDGVRYGRVNL